MITTDGEPKPSRHVQCALGVDRDGNTHYCCSVAVMWRGCRAPVPVGTHSDEGYLPPGQL